MAKSETGLAPGKKEKLTTARLVCRGHVAIGKLLRTLFDSCRKDMRTHTRESNKHVERKNNKNNKVGPYNNRPMLYCGS